MISRKCCKLIAEAYEVSFSKYHAGDRFTSGYDTVNTTALYDFLYENDYAAYFCNAARDTYRSHSTRGLKEFIMKLHTGETLYTATNDWTWQQREHLGQEHLRDLAEDILNKLVDILALLKARGIGVDRDRALALERLKKQLELEGYEYRDRKLLQPETDVLDVAEETGVLRSLHKELGLANADTTFHHLELTEHHYVEGRWDDSISNSRKFLESVLQEIAAAHSQRVRGEVIADRTYSSALHVRDYLEKQGLVEPKEKKALSAVYGLLSDTGSHPYMAQKDQARLLRHLALTLSQFAMLRLRGCLSGHSR